MLYDGVRSKGPVIGVASLAWCRRRWMAKSSGVVRRMVRHGCQSPRCGNMSLGRRYRLEERRGDRMRQGCAGAARHL